MEPNRYRSFHLRILSVIIIFSVVPTLVFWTAVYNKFRSTYKRKLISSLTTLVQDGRDTVELLFEGRIQQLFALFSIFSPESLQDEASLDKLLIALQAGSDAFIDLEAIDGAGNRRAYSGPDRPGNTSANYAHEQWFRRVTAFGVSVSDVFVNSEQVSCAFVAVRGTGAQQPWTLRASIRTASLEDVLRSLHPGDRGDAYLINRSNVLQTTPRFSGTLLGHPNGPDLSSSQGSHVEEINFGNYRSFFAVASFQNPSWVLVLQEDSGQDAVGVLNGIHYQLLAVGAISMLLVIGAMVLARFLKNELTRVDQENEESVRNFAQADMIRALGRMAAGIAHEVNNPLAIMSGHAGWMEDLLAEEDVKRSTNFPHYIDCLDNIQSQVRRCKTVTQRLLNFGRSVAKDQETVEINQLLALTVTFFSSEAYFRDIEIQANYADGLPPTETDPRKIQQFFVEAIDQLIEWIGKNGSIEVKTNYSPSSDEIVIDLSCVSSGASPPKVGKAEARLSAAKASELSVSYDTIEKLGGRVVSIMKTGGLTLTIHLPVRRQMPVDQKVSFDTGT